MNKEDNMCYRRSVFVLLCLSLILSASCTKLRTPFPGEQALERQVLPQKDAIPAEWGKLISASNSPSFPNWIQLWFQDDAGLVRMVPYNIDRNILAPDVVLFRRN